MLKLRHVARITIEPDVDKFGPQKPPICIKRVPTGLEPTEERQCDKVGHKHWLIKRMERERGRNRVFVGPLLRQTNSIASQVVICMSD